MHELRTFLPAFTIQIVVVQFTLNAILIREPLTTILAFGITL